MLFSSYSILVSCLSGLMSGLIVRSNAFNVCDYLKLPECFLNLLIKFLNIILLSNKEPKEESSFINDGATQSDRRQQYIEQYEQFSFLNQSSLITPSTSGASLTVSNQSTSAINEEELEQNINQLQEMGFDSEKAKQTLKNTNNDLNRATHLLLEDN